MKNNVPDHMTPDERAEFERLRADCENGTLWELPTLSERELAAIDAANRAYIAALLDEASDG